MNRHRKIDILILGFFAAGAPMVFNLVPDGIFVSIPFNDTPIDGQGYVYLGFIHVMALCFTSALCHLDDDLYFEFNALFILEFVSAMDYAFRYGVDFYPGLDTNTVKLTGYTATILFKKEILFIIDYVKTKSKRRYRE
jgi:hypothetical protein